MTVTEDQFTEKFNPQVNHLDDNASWGGWNKDSDDGCMYETFGEEEEYVKMIAKSEPNRVWTILEVDGEAAIVSGAHFVNRMGYMITEHPWTEDTEVEVDNDFD